MAQEDLAIRFSNKTYATKAEVSRVLGISQVDTIWSSIISYRSHFTSNLDLRNIERTPFNFVMTPLIAQRVTNVERKLTKAMVKYSRLSLQDLTRYNLRRSKLVQCLKWITAKYQLDVTDDFLMNLIVGNISSLAPQDLILQKYLDCLVHLEKYYDDAIDEKFLSLVYGKLSGYQEIKQLYRIEDLEDGGSKAIINRVYNAAPAERIAAMMKNLMEFIQNSDISFFVKAVASFYFIQYIKPFDCYSEEIAILFMKDVLAHGDIDQLATLLDFEMLISSEGEVLQRIFQEVQKTNDLTYLIIYATEKCEAIITTIFDTLTTLNAEVIEQEFFKEENLPEEDKSEKPIEMPSDFNNPSSSSIDYEIKVALPIMPIGLDEKDATKIEEHLLEMNPNLKKADAHFYARHCTIGKYYNIQQFKKVIVCAYETARTSMDRLVYEGFYRKEMIKNKFVYTPIPRK